MGYKGEVMDKDVEEVLAEVKVEECKVAENATWQAHMAGGRKVQCGAGRRGRGRGGG